MARTSIPLKKTIYGNRGFSNQVDIEFRELTSASEKFTIDKFFRLYDKLFFAIPKKGGEKSHSALYARSLDYVRNYIDPKDTEIEMLMEEIARLEDSLSEVIEENPFFPNGKLMTNPNWDHDNPDQSGVPQAYVMEAGRKRAIYYWGEHKVLRESLGYTAQQNAGEHVGSGWKGYIPTTQAMLDNIPTGPDIRKAEDLFNMEYLEPSPFENFNRLRISLEQSTLTAGQIFYLRKRLEQQVPESAGEDDINRILNMDQNNIKNFILLNFYDRFALDQTLQADVGFTPDQLATHIMNRVLEILSGGEENSYVKSIRNKSLERSTTLLKQAVADVIFVGKENGIYPENPPLSSIPESLIGQAITTDPVTGQIVNSPLYGT